MKTVAIIGHAFDCVPAHVTVNARGTGTTIPTAVARALREMLADKRLRRKHIGAFRITVVMTDPAKPDA